MVPLAWNFVLPAFLGFLIGSTYVLTFGLVAALVVFVLATALLGLWRATGLYPFNRLALVFYAVSAALVGRGGVDVLARLVRRWRGRLQLRDLTLRDEGWAGEEAVDLMRLARAGLPIRERRVNRRAATEIAPDLGTPEASWSDERSWIVSTRDPSARVAHRAVVRRRGSDEALAIDRMAPLDGGVGAHGPSPRTADWLGLVERAEWALGSAAIMECTVADGTVKIEGCARLSVDGWPRTWLSGGAADLAADPVCELERDLVESTWGWDRLLLGTRDSMGVRFFRHRPYVSFDATRGFPSAGTAAGSVHVTPARHSWSNAWIAVQDLIRPSQARSRHEKDGRSASFGPHGARAAIGQVCAQSLAPMRVWGITANVATGRALACAEDDAERAWILAKVQSPEVRAAAALAREVAALESLVSAPVLRSSSDWGSVVLAIADPEHRRRVEARVAEFLERHGFRGRGERSLVGPRWSDAPSELGSWLARSPTGEPERAERSRPWSWIALLDPLEWWLAGWVWLGRRAMDMRLRARERAGRSLAELRGDLLAAGAELERQGVLDRPSDVFQLSLREWRSALEDRADVRDVARRRRHAFEADAAHDPPSVLIEGVDDRGAGLGKGGGEVVSAAPVFDEAALRGTPVSAGRARGKVALVHDHPASPVPGPGCVIVARDANPHHAPMLVGAAALVCERGGLLSHLAIVARELGIPAVMGVQGAASALQGGALVEVDGRVGLVTPVDDASSS